jgi:hypothetical protein
MKANIRVPRERGKVRPYEIHVHYSSAKLKVQVFITTCDFASLEDERYRLVLLERPERGQHPRVRGRLRSVGKKGRCGRARTRQQNDDEMLTMGQRRFPRSWSPVQRWTA